mgnify:CR=1 FL=1
MICEDYLFIVNLIRKSVCDKNYAIGSFADIKQVASIIVRSGILLTVYPVLKSEAEKSDAKPEIVSLEEMLRKKYLLTVRQSVIQGYEGQRVLESLSENGFNCIALKGWELRKMYPQENMRQMADLDILVSPYEYAKIKSVMSSIGYSSENDESSWKHDDFRKNEVCIEMHKRLTDDSGLIQQWEKQMWDRAVRENDSNIFKMNNEDYYIFHFIHLHKDFMNGSLGLRRLIDTFLLENTEYNGEIIEKEFEKLGILVFRNRIIKLCRSLMGEIEFDENSEIMLNHAMCFGIYGTQSSYKAGRIAAMGNDGLNNGKMRSLVSAVFLPVDRMKAQFQILEKHPYLLPLCWIKRIFRLLRGGIKKNRQLLDYSDVSQTEFDEMKRFFEAGGVRN